MARPVSDAGFLRLPPATAVLLLTTVFGLTSSHALPRQTKTVELHELNVVPFPQPTEAPVLLPDLLRRQSQNTICGYIGGDPDLPATCSIGSHCVLEKDHGVVGCCPDGGTCSTGIFTGCVDRNSPPQTEINPYVYTCQGSNLCYRNEFAGGYYQYGCGTASSLGTTVETSVDGMTTSLVFEETSVSLTASPAALSEPTSIGSLPPSETDPDGTTSPTTDATSPPTTGPSSTTSLKSPTTKSQSTTTATTPSSSLSTTDPPNTTSSTTDGTPIAPPTNTSAPEAETSGTNTGAIIGGSISGAAVLIAILVAAILFYMRKHRGNNREGPGPLPSNAPPRTEYISPMRSHGAAFAPLPSWQDDDEDRRPLTQYPSQQPYYPAYEQQWQATPSTAAAVAARPPPANRGFSQPLRYPPAAVHAIPMGVGTGLTPVAEEEHSHYGDGSDHEHNSYNSNTMIRNNSNNSDRGGGGAPLHSSEIDDFSRAYSSAGIGTQEMDPLADDNNRPGSGTSSPESRSPSRGAGGSHRPLWQQNRQQGRNLMWL
ncbi:hypothetical protein F5Y04DRAFT_106599 [Hypomontagnella monticulosa]|nr:hypothetical protein F5Y04DRAFT_106599 [Hypomontagnella monticulosa]